MNIFGLIAVECGPPLSVTVTEQNVLLLSWQFIQITHAPE